MDCSEMKPFPVALIASISEDDEAFLLCCTDLFDV